MIDISLYIATVNGSGSQSANHILLRTLFRMGLPVSGKNIFPSNISGLPSWFAIRVNERGLLSRRSKCEILVAYNASSLQEDLQHLNPGGVLLYNEEFGLKAESLPESITQVPIPFRKLCEGLSDSIKMRKLMMNMVYVGTLAKLMELSPSILREVIHDHFKGQETIIAANYRAIDAGMDFAASLNIQNFPFVVKEVPTGNRRKILIDGNSAAAIGALYGGCTFVSWYPITPSTSLVESFTHWAQKYRKDGDGKDTYCVEQTEDELSAIASVLGAGWAGARAMTATSGPGLSLMAEAAGLGYFAEIPAVIWDVQRVGPSTGLPTRTMQADVIAAAKLSHGDTRHILLIPGTALECFEFAQLAFDIAEKIQTPVICLSDLDLGMNYWMSPAFKPPQHPYDRGKLMTAQDLEEFSFARYEDVDGDGIPRRTLPGTDHPKAAYFTRGTGHDEHGRYSEDNEVFKRNMIRLTKKMTLAKRLIPESVLHMVNSRVGLIAYGSSDQAVYEARSQLKAQGLDTSYLRIRAYPFRPEVDAFIKAHERLYIIEQNRDAQMLCLLKEDYGAESPKMKPVVQFDGLPLEAEFVTEAILNLEKDHGPNPS